eukprot:5180432-Lingulodinium_polyedra.AAC.1
MRSILHLSSAAAHKCQHSGCSAAMARKFSKYASKQAVLTTRLPPASAAYLSMRRMDRYTRKQAYHVSRFGGPATSIGL